MPTNHRLRGLPSIGYFLCKQLVGRTGRLLRLDVPENCRLSARQMARLPIEQAATLATVSLPAARRVSNPRTLLVGLVTTRIIIELPFKNQYFFTPGIEGLR